ncbi:O-antigen ligase family protein [uncultured Amphritea sp.]|uniref:O-antigen ligase family protein n=1 Tax=uncultured Amphritea sp. TaxID=981605 RepID=UPI002606ACBA|nr:O-antigen ligase family protein [uncultured Amphritea sp.]
MADIKERVSLRSMPFVKAETPLVILFTLLLVGAGLLGAFSTLGFLIIGLFFVVTRFPYVLAGCRINWPLLLYPLLGLLSTVWADYPKIAFIYSLQLLVSIVLFIAVIYTVSFKKIILAAAISLSCVMFLSLFSHNTVTISFTGEVVRVGLFGSKNNMAGSAATAMLCAIAVFMIFRESVMIRALAVACVLLSAATFLQANSLGTTVSVFFFIGITFFLYMYSKSQISLSTKTIQLMIFVFVIIFGLTLCVYMFDYSAFEEFMYSIGKDPTLTGRTDIWLIAMESFPEHMWGGVGRGSYFQADNIGAIEIWETHFVEIGAPFGFHNTYIMGLIEQGIPGFLIMCLVFFKGLQGVIRGAIFNMTEALAFSTCIFLITFSKTFIETLGFAQFSYGTFMLCWSWIVLTKGTYFDQYMRIRVVL